MSNQSNNGEPLIRVSHLKQYFPINTGFFLSSPARLKAKAYSCKKDGTS